MQSRGGTSGGGIAGFFDLRTRLTTITRNVLVVIVGVSFWSASLTSNFADPNDRKTSFFHIGKFRVKSEEGPPAGFPYIVDVLDLRQGEHILDIGAGDGSWSRLFAEKIGGKGTVHAAEINRSLVDQMKKAFAAMPQIRPYLCRKDDPGLTENSCDVIFISDVYHHLPDRVNYIKRLLKVAKPSGRLCILERNQSVSRKWHQHASPFSQLIRETEEAGWVLVHYYHFPGLVHGVAIFVPKGRFLVNQTE